MVMMGMTVQDLFDFKFLSIIDGDGGQRRDRRRVVWDSFRILIGMEVGDMEDGVDSEGVRERKFVSDREYLLDNTVGANELVL